MENGEEFPLVKILLEIFELSKYVDKFLGKYIYLFLFNANSLHTLLNNFCLFTDFGVTYESFFTLNANDIKKLIDDSDDRFTFVLRREDYAKTCIIVSIFAILITTYYI